MAPSQRVNCSLYGFIGSFVPSIIKMFNNLPNFVFVFRWEWAVVVLLYGAIGSLVAAIYPYRGVATSYKALLVGCSFPTIIGAAVAILHAPGVGVGLGHGTTFTPWNVWDFLALF